MTFPARARVLPNLPKSLPLLLTTRMELSETVVKILNLSDSGMSIRQIAKVMGIGKSTVAVRLQEGQARRYGLGQDTRILNRGCKRERAALPTIDPTEIDRLVST